METVDTALKSLDLVLFDYNILGTIGVPYVLLQCHLWVMQVCFSLIFVLKCKMLFLGTMGTTMVPKNIRVEKYDVWAF